MTDELTKLSERRLFCHPRIVAIEELIESIESVMTVGTTHQLKQALRTAIQRLQASYATNVMQTASLLTDIDMLQTELTRLRADSARLELVKNRATAERDWALRCKEDEETDYHRGWAQGYAEAMDCIFTIAIDKAMQEEVGS